MNILPPALTKVIESFEKLPGIGPKTAQRLTFYLLHIPQEELERFSENIISLKKNTMLCSVCKNVTTQDPCPVCANPGRDIKSLCVVQEPTDVLALEKTGMFHGRYHVLHGAIDPLNNIGPDEIYLDQLFTRITHPSDQTEEIILALNPSMEGEATAMYIQKQFSNIVSEISHPIKITRIAHGLPVGADIEYADEVTLRRALEGRRDY